MKYILMMAAPKAGVDTYRVWSKQDIQAHDAVLKGINKEPTEAGEFVPTERLAAPEQAKVVRPERTECQSRTGCLRRPKSFS